MLDHVEMRLRKAIVLPEPGVTRSSPAVKQRALGNSHEVENRLITRPCCLCRLASVKRKRELLQVWVRGCLPNIEIMLVCLSL